MAKEYIEREALIVDVDDWLETAHIQSITRETEEAKTLWRGTYGGANYCRNLILDAPAADVVERKRGEWIDNIDENGLLCNKWRKCSVCGGLNFSKRPPYCPNCGTDMRGENDAID